MIRLPAAIPSLAAIALFSMMPAALNAAESGQSAFEAAYASSLQELQTYRETGFLVGLRERPAAREAVTAAYELGKQTVTDPLVLAELTANYASVLDDFGKAEQLLREAIDLVEAYQEENGNTEALIRPLMSIGHLNYYFKGLNGANKYYKRAFRLADEYWAGELRLADLYLEAGVRLSGHSHSTGKDYMRDALAIYSAASGPQAIEGQAFTNMHLGRYWIRRGQLVKARSALEDGLAVIGDGHNDSAVFLGLHTQLVRLYVQMQEPELAGRHSQIIGSTYAGQASDELIPLYTASPRYPPNALRLQEAGEVTLSFTVNELGEVVNPVVVKRTGHHEFERAAIDAAKVARYAPRFVNGKAVATENVLFTFRFGIIE